jgi:hypothetical protein
MALDSCLFDVLAIFELETSFNRRTKPGNPCVYNKSKKNLKGMEQRHSKAGMLKNLYIGQCVNRSIYLM